MLNISSIVRERTQREEEFFRINRFNINSCKYAQMSPKFQERKAAADTAQRVSGGVVDGASGVMEFGVDNVSASGQLYGQGLRQSAALIKGLGSIGFAVVGVGLSLAIRRAKTYSDHITKFGGNGFAVVGIEKHNNNLFIGGFNNNTALDNLTNQSRLANDRIADITMAKTEPSKYVELERQMLKQDIFFVDSTQGTLNLKLGKTLTDKEASALNGIIAKHKIPSWGIKQGAMGGSNSICLTGLTAADAECFVQTLYRKYFEERNALLSKFIDDKSDDVPISATRLAQIKKGLSDFSDDEWVALKNYIKKHNSRENGDESVLNRGVEEAISKAEVYRGMPVEFNDIGNGRQWVSLNRVDNSFASGFINEMDGKDMNVNFKFLSNDGIKVANCMNVAGLKTDKGLAGGECTFNDFVRENVTNTQFTLEPYHITVEEFSNFVKDTLPDLPWVRTDNPTQVLVPSNQTMLLNSLFSQKFGNDRRVVTDEINMNAAPEFANSFAQQRDM